MLAPGLNRDLKRLMLVRRPLNLGQVDAFFHHLVERRKLAQFLHNVDDLGGT